jgi:hypothetical protein
MYRTDKKLEVKLRLGEIQRRSAELSAVSSELADMMAQLDRLRKLDERIGIGVLSIANRTVGHTRRGIQFSRGLTDEH